MAAIPALAGTAVALVDGAQVLNRREGEAGYLVLDHGARPGAGAAFVEWWEAESPREGGLAGLFLLGDAHRPPTLAVAPFPCGALVAALTESD